MGTRRIPSPLLSHLGTAVIEPAGADRDLAPRAAMATALTTIIRSPSSPPPPFAAYRASAQPHAAAPAAAEASTEGSAQ
jgi:hypothetical protein